MAIIWIIVEENIVRSENFEKNHIIQCHLKTVYWIGSSGIQQVTDRENKHQWSQYISMRNTTIIFLKDDILPLTITLYMQSAWNFLYSSIDIPWYFITFDGFEKLSMRHKIKCFTKVNVNEIDSILNIIQSYKIFNNLQEFNNTYFFPSLNICL